MRNLRFAFRMLKQNPLLLYIGVPGLAVGLCAVLLLAVYFKYEFSFDKQFPTNSRVLRLCNILHDQDRTRVLSESLRTAYTQLPEQVPEIEKAVQLYAEAGSTIKTENGMVKDITLMYTDPEFFDVFGLKLLQGNASDALIGIENIVLTKSVAEKLFGTSDCLGRSVKIDNRQLIVAGIMNDIPKTTHFKADILAPMQSNDFVIKEESLEFSTYYLINKGAGIEKAGQNIAKANNNLMDVWKNRGSLNNIEVETTTDLLRNIHLHTKVQDDRVPKVNMSQLFIVAGVAVLILLIATINFINMYLMYGEKRIAEISSRKVAGASRRELALQFYRENGTMAVLALLIGLVLADLAQPFFVRMTALPLSLRDMFNPIGIGIIIMILIVLVLITSSYPGIILSKISLIWGLRGKYQHISKGVFAKSVVLVQFFVTVLLICSMVIIRAQIKYMEKVPLGFNDRNVIEVSDFSIQTAKNAETIRQELVKIPFIQSVGLSEHGMGGNCSGQGIALLNSGSERAVKEYRVFPGFCETMQMRLLKGKYFADNYADKNSIILNKSAASMLGLQFTEGIQVRYKDQPVEVKGIVDDFYFDGYAGKTIEPLVICCVKGLAWNYYLRTNSKFTIDNRKQVAAVFKKFNPESEATFTPLCDIYNAKFEKDERVLEMVSSGAILAIILSFVGMISLTVLNVERRTKEIGIRKVVGCSELELVTKLMEETLVLVGIASLLAFAVSYYLLMSWLNNFAVRINMHIGYFLLSGLSALILALLSVSWLSWRAATKNPVEALRYE